MEIRCPKINGFASKHNLLKQCGHTHHTETLHQLTCTLGGQTESEHKLSQVHASGRQTASSQCKFVFNYYMRMFGQGE